MANKSYKYEFTEFLADLEYIEELKRDWKWSSREELDTHVCNYFASLYGREDIKYAEWRYYKWMAVVVYVSSNAESFNFGDLSAVGSDHALGSGRLFHPIFDYAIENEIDDWSAFPAPEFFHQNPDR